MVLDAIAEVGFEGTALGPPGFLGTANVLMHRLNERGLRLAEAFLPFHLSRSDLFDDEFAELGSTLDLLCEGASDGAMPVAVISDGFQDPQRWPYAGRARLHPETRLSKERIRLLIGNLHRVAERCRGRGLMPVLHHHAGTFIETEPEIREAVEAMDTDLVGLCLDTGHACFGGADPLALLSDYHSMVEHVHLKDMLDSVVAGESSEKLDFTVLTVAGAFCPLGDGDVPLNEFCRRLKDLGYAGWILVEQDTILFDPSEFAETVRLQRANRQFIHHAGLG